MCTGFGVVFKKTMASMWNFALFNASMIGFYLILGYLKMRPKEPKKCPFLGSKLPF